MSLNPTALLKIIAALTPIMGNAELGAAMADEIREMFASMKRTADALESIVEQNKSMWNVLINIDTKLGGPVAAADIPLLESYVGHIEQAIALGEQPHAAD